MRAPQFRPGMGMSLVMGFGGGQPQRQQFPRPMTPAEFKQELGELIAELDGPEWTVELVLLRERELRVHVPDSLEHRAMCVWLDRNVPDWNAGLTPEEATQLEVELGFTPCTELRQLSRQLPQGSPKRPLIAEALEGCQHEGVTL